VRARRQAWWIALGCAIVAVPGLAAPAEPAPKQAPPPPRTYRPYVDRGNAIPAPYALGTLGLGNNVHIGSPTQAEFSLGFAAGLTPRIWVDGSIGTLRWAPSLVFHSAQIGLNALLVDAPSFELDAMVHVSGPADDGRYVEQIEPGLYAVAHVAHALRVDVNPAFDVNPGPRTTYGLRVPTAFSFQLGEHVYASVTTGVTVGSFADAGATTAIPAGLGFGWSDYLGTKGPRAIAIAPSISFPQLVKPWANERFRPDILTWGITFYYVWKH
jgi:hypothetical protein